ncbi:MAG: dolichol-phosphate mannosyltransferase, partial [Cyanobacteria bacterium J083]
MLKNLLKAQLPFFVIVTGIAFTLGLQLLIPEGVFFSGDAGLKALLTKQLSQGIWRFDLIPPDLAWVKSLWQADLYPYAPPFAYYINQK